MTTQSTTDVHSQALGSGSSSNVIQNGSYVCNVLFAIIIVILLWRSDDNGLNKRFDEMDRHHTQEITDLRRELNDFESRQTHGKQDHDNRVQQWEDYTYTHVNKLDAILAALGRKTPAHLSTPP